MMPSFHPQEDGKVLLMAISYLGIFMKVASLQQSPYHDLTLLTRNKKHYGRIPTLKVEFPTH